MVERQERRTRETINIKPHAEAEFPQDPEKRFEAVFSSIGNSEAKCLSLLCLTQSPLTSADLQHKFLEESGGVWRINSKTQEAYYLKTLIPIGLVAEADILHYGAQEYINGFRLTHAGLRYGQPIAVFLLQKSTEFPYSLLKIFGQTSKSGGETRSVLNRAKILEFLSNVDAPQRREDIARQLGINASAVGRNSMRLAELGLVEYSSVNVEERGYAPYTLLDGVKREDIKALSPDPRLTFEVGEIIFELKRVNSSLLAERLRDRHPKRKIESLRTAICAILSKLTQQGICQPELFVGRKIHSQVKITETGKGLVSGIILPIKQSLADDYQGEILRASWRKIPWQDYAQEAILKYEESSGNVNWHSLEEWAEGALAFISQNPGIRPKEIKSPRRGRVLQILLSQGKIRKEKNGRAVRYFPQ